jgi:hypothetical protein
MTGLREEIHPNASYFRINQVTLPNGRPRWTPPLEPIHEDAEISNVLARAPVAVYKLPRTLQQALSGTDNSSRQELVNGVSTAAHWDEEKFTKPRNVMPTNTRRERSPIQDTNYYRV